MCEYKNSFNEHWKPHGKNSQLKKCSDFIYLCFLLYFISLVVFILKTLHIVREINFTTYSSLLVFHMCIEMKWMNVKAWILFGGFRWNLYEFSRIFSAKCQKSYNAHHFWPLFGRNFKKSHSVHHFWDSTERNVKSRTVHTTSDLCLK